MTRDTPISGKQFVSVQAAARMLSISTSSIQRLCDQGMLAFLKTAGGHRRISLASIVDHANSNKLSHVVNLDPRLPNPYDLDVLSCLIDGAIPQLVYWLKGTAKQVAHKLDNELCGAIYRLNQACLQEGVELEKLWLAIETARAVLDSYKVELLPEQSSWPIAVGGTMTGNFDWLGSRMVEICMRECSIRAIGLGSNLRPQEIAQAVMDLEAKLVWLSYSHLEDTSVMIQWHHDLALMLPKTVQVLVGGGAISPAIRRSLPTHRYFESLVGMVDFLHLEFPEQSLPESTGVTATQVPKMHLPAVAYAMPVQSS